MRLFLAVDISGSMLEGSKAFVTQHLIKAALFECALGRVDLQPQDVSVVYCAHSMEQYQPDDSWQMPLPSETLPGDMLTQGKISGFMKEISPAPGDLLFFFSDRQMILPDGVRTVLLGDEEEISGENIPPENFLAELLLETKSRI